MIGYRNEQIRKQNLVNKKQGVNETIRLHEYEYEYNCDTFKVRFRNKQKENLDRETKKRLKTWKIKKIKGLQLGAIIKGLKTYNWETQNRVKMYDTCMWENQEVSKMSM